jgi:phage terminase large subunit
LTDSEYADHVCELIEPLFKVQASLIEKGEIQYTDTIKTIVDPSAASFIAELKRRGFFKVKKAKNNVLDGIRDTNKCIQYGIIRMDSSIKEWTEEAGGYVWDEKAPDDRPVKIADHICDAVRYFVETNHLAKVDSNGITQLSQYAPQNVGYF